MPTPTRDEILGMLAPLEGASRIEHVAVQDGAVTLVLRADGKDSELASLRNACMAALGRLGIIPRIVTTAEVAPAQRAPAQWNREGLPHVKRVVAVASGKGGVGKSTVSVGLAYAAAGMGQRVGLLDADIYGPSIPLMLGLSGQPEFAGGAMQPLVKDGIRAMSIGFLMGDQAAILRGPMITKTLAQLLRGTAWGSEDAPLDLLLVDLPPGTGDVQLSLAQNVPLDGAVLVTTPQAVAVADARKAAAMFQKLSVPILGVVENMAGLFDPESGRVLPMFGVGGGAKLAEETKAPLLTSLPLYPQLAAGLDRGAFPEAYAERFAPAVRAIMQLS